MSHAAALPNLTGRALAFARRLAGWAPARHGIASLARDALGVSALAHIPLEYRVELPYDPRPIRARPVRRWDTSAALARPHCPGWPRTSDALMAAYRRGVVRPGEVVARALDELARLAALPEPVELCVATLAAQSAHEARAAEARYLAGAPLPLDGVPLLVKDVLDVAGQPTRMGAARVPPPAARDATVVERLRTAGAALLGKTTMTELGISPLGTSVHHRLPGNAHRRGHAAGGSSTGSAVAVALGIVPVASGSDAGGSVRIPASLNGLFGLKPTFGRVSRTGEVLGGSVNHVGAIGASSTDLAHFLDAVARATDAADPFTAWADPAPEGGFGWRLGEGVRGLRIGVDESEWLACAPPVARACRAALAALEREGAVLVPVHLPLARHAPAVGIATVGAEGAALSRALPPDFAEALGDDVRLAMHVGAATAVGDFLDAQRVRGAIARQLAAVLREVDVLALPTVPTSAPAVRANPTDGSASDGAVVTTLCRYAFLANITGVPAGTAPVGLDPHGVPIGLQIVGDAWDEAGVLAVLAHLERMGFAPPRAPGALDLLG